MENSCEKFRLSLMPLSQWIKGFCISKIWRKFKWVLCYTQLTGFVARGPRALQPCAISKDVESS